MWFCCGFVLWEFNWFRLRRSRIQRANRSRFGFCFSRHFAPPRPTCNIPIPIPVIHSAAYGGCGAVREKCIERVMLMVHQQQLAAVADWERGHWLEIELFCYIYYIYYIYIHRSTGTTNPLLQYTTYTYIDFIMATCLYFIRIVQAN